MRNSKVLQPFIRQEAKRIAPMWRVEVHKFPEGADGKPTAGDDPLWASFDYKKLRETLESIVSSMEATAQQMEDPLPVEPEPVSNLRLVVSNDQPESGEDPTSDGPVKLPA
jgi:hypothetical protein